MVLLIPKLRCQFAEFLNDCYLKRLCILYLLTCGSIQVRLLLVYLFPEHSNVRMVLPKRKKRTTSALTLTLSCSFLQQVSVECCQIYLKIFPSFNPLGQINKLRGRYLIDILMNTISLRRGVIPFSLLMSALSLGIFSYSSM